MSSTGIEAKAKSLQSCPTLCDPIDGSPPELPSPWDSGKNTGVGCHFLLQCVKVKLLSHVRLLATPWTAAHQAPPSMGISRQEYWSGLPLPSPKQRASAASYTYCHVFLGGSLVKDPPGSARSAGLIPKLGKCPGGGHGNPLRYSCRENPMDRGAW